MNTSTENFSLLKSISQAANEKQTVLENLSINMTAFEHPTLVCEMAEDFLNEISGKLRGNGVFSPDEIKRIAPTLAILQLLTKEDTREAILSRFKGQPDKNLISIAKNVVKPSEPAGRVDQLLQQLGQVNARALMDKNSAILNDPQSLGRKQLITDVEKLTQWFQSFSSQQTNKDQKPEMQPNQQTPGSTTTPAATNAQQTATPGSSAPAASAPAASPSMAQAA